LRGSKLTGVNHLPEYFRDEAGKKDVLLFQLDIFFRFTQAGSVSFSSVTWEVMPSSSWVQPTLR